MFFYFGITKGGGGGGDFCQYKKLGGGGGWYNLLPLFKKFLEINKIVNIF